MKPAFSIDTPDLETLEMHVHKLAYVGLLVYTASAAGLGRVRGGWWAKLFVILIRAHALVPLMNHLRRGAQCCRALLFTSL